MRPRRSFIFSGTLRLCAFAMSGWLALTSAAQAAGAPLGFDDARHLLNRTSFAANAEDIHAFARLTREQAAERLLGWARKPPVTAPPAWVDAPFESPRQMRMMGEEERKAFQREQFEKGIELRAWWLTEMLTTSSPFTEKMTLFWHNHFVSSQQKVRSPQLMYRQNVLLRRHALGNFGQLLHAVAKDPAMLIYLDGVSSRKGQPNENFAREVMELFTLGEGAYGEQDIKEAARAFTGWSLDPRGGEFVFRRALHDDGVKTVLGRSGRLDGEAVLDILLAQPQTAEFVVAKLWREFVSPRPDAQEVKRIARVFRDSGYEIRAALRALLVSDAFYARENRASLIKSPVDLVVGTLRQFGFSTGEVLPFVFATSGLGQNLFAPPNVRGWPGGENWINSSTLLGRKAFLERLFRVDETRAMLAAAAGGMERAKGTGRLTDGRERFLRAMMDVSFDGPGWLARFQGDAAALQRVVLAAAPVTAPPAGMQGMDLIRHLTMDPVYQLK
ncbi:MAG: DUF1800 domain-containing protein [Betaproteobacteria bacterium]|nr:DUF1800 domain-containing protein [Betaproteobacteria bacterium]